MSNFLGDLGGGNDIGRDGIVDYDFKSNLPSIEINYGYRFSGKFSAYLKLNYGYLKGDDAFTEETYRNGRNLHFRSYFFETSLLAKFDLFGPTIKKNSLGKVRKSKVSFNFYILAGAGYMFFNPKAYYNGNWVNLQELGTEGQGLPGMASPYQLSTLVLPYGFGFGKDFNRRWSFNAEILFRATFTDYIDDVSTDYYGREALIKAKMDMGQSLETATAAAELSDPNTYGLTHPELGIKTDADLKGEQRGDPSDNDSYLTVMFTLSRKINFLRSNRRAF